MIRNATTVLAAFLGLAALALPAAWPGEARAAASQWWTNEHGAVRLIAASDAVGDRRTLRLGIHFRMNDNWKIYWRSPGDAGFPPQPDWSGSRNLDKAALSWPAPERFSVIGLETLGYSGEVVLPVDATLVEPGSPLVLRAKIPYLTCDDVCVPYVADLALRLPDGAATSSVETALIERFDALVPRSGPGLPIRVASVAAVGGDVTRALEISIAADAPLSRPDIYVEGPEGWAFGAPDYRIGSDGKTAFARVAALAPPRGGGSLAGREMRFTVVDGVRAAEQALTPAAARTASPAAAPPAERGLWLVLLLAVAGGLILNLMPCVLPVLSLKLVSAMGHGGGDRRDVRTGFLASAAGILVSFLVLASGVAGLRLAGESVGWGVQFQQPVFLAFMAVVVTLFSANLFGLFEIRLPGRVSDMAVGASGHGKKGVVGHFLTGVFATLLATPCSAPFLGTAVSFALSRGSAEIYAVFLCLGIGLALPYLAGAAFPGIATRMPRPGQWMVTLRRGLGILLLGTAVWLVTVLAVQLGTWPAVAVAAALGMLLVGLAFARPGAERTPRLGRGVAGVAGAAALAIAVWSGSAPDGARTAAAHWMPFDRQAIASAVASGEVVFVDVTADWCITCQVNKALVLNNEPVRGRLAGDGVVAMIADWTRPSDEIGAYLESFGRFGIPFNAVYGPARPNGEPLPELLTEAAVLEAMDRAAGRPPRIAER